MVTEKIALDGERVGAALDRVADLWPEGLDVVPGSYELDLKRDADTIRALAAFWMDLNEEASPTVVPPVADAAALRAGFERIAASRDREEAEEAYDEFEEILEAVLARLARYEAMLLDARRYVASGTLAPEDLILVGRIDALLVETGAIEERVAELRDDAKPS